MHVHPALPCILLAAPLVFLPPEAEALPNIAFDMEAVIPPEISRLVQAAAKHGRGYDIVTGSEVYFADRAVLAHPGVRLRTENNSCTAGFVYGAPGSYRILTAGHCLSSNEVYVLPLPGVLVQIGTTSGPGSYDTGFIDVLPTMQSHVDPDVPHAMGPTGVHRDPVSGADHLSFTFWGQPWVTDPLLLAPVDYIGMPGVGVITRVDDGGQTFRCLCAFVPGNSGGPIVDVSGRALGIVTGIDAGVPNIGRGTFVKVFTEDPALGDRVPISPASLAPCADGVDNDGDGRTDFPADADCATPGNLEGPQPECSDGYNNDADLWPDWPLDPQCTDPEDDSEES